jgi:large subunit ribosomal protein L21
MYAIVEIAGQQFKVAKDQKLFVHHLPQAEGESVEFEKVLLVDDGSDVKVGSPVLNNAKVTAKVLQQLVKGEKVIVFKKKRRKGYQKSNGHRQQFSQILIENIAF